MKRITMIFALLACLHIGCQEYDQRVLPTIGLYNAAIIGYGDPFQMIVSADRNDNIFIEAPFCDEVWEVITADTDIRDEGFSTYIDIDRQELEPGVWIDGEGIYFDFSIQLDYTIDFWGDRVDYTLIGTKL